MQFDPYLNWLGIPVHEQPPHFYRLLGVVLFESSPQVIEQAADRQSLRLNAYRVGPQAALCQRLMSEVAMARFSLLDPQQKANYDARLQEVLAHRGERSVAAPPPPPGPAPCNLPPRQAIMPQLPAVQAMAPPVLPLPPMPQSAPPMSPAGIPYPPAAPVRPYGSAPLAAPFPMAAGYTVATPGNGAASTPAPPIAPPAAPLRPLEELEKLTSLESNRHRLAKKKKQAVSSREILIAAFAVMAGAIGVIMYLAFQNGSQAESGYNSIGHGAAGDKSSAARPMGGDTMQPRESSTATDESAQTPRSPPRKSPAAAPKKSASSDGHEFTIKLPARSRPHRDIDPPQDLGGDNDPVMGPGGQ